MQPIDPSDLRGLQKVYSDAWDESLDADNSDYDTDETCILAVARAVLPEGYAVYDTRTHVVLDIDAIRSWVAAIDTEGDDLDISYLRDWFDSLIPEQEAMTDE